MTTAMSDGHVEEVLEDIRSLLSRSVALQEGDIELEKERGSATADLVQHAATDTALAQQRTGLAQESTSLVRAQTRLSTRSTELAEIRTSLAQERSRLASERSDLAAVRTDFARARTNLAQQRVRMAETRTQLAETRTKLSTMVTTYSKLRTELARNRTHFALIRTGLALLTLSVFLSREFAVSWWTIFDVALGIASIAATAVGFLAYRRTRREIRHLDATVSRQEEELPFLSKLLSGLVDD